MTAKPISKATSTALIQGLAVLDDGLLNGLVLGLLMALGLLRFDSCAAEDVGRNADSDEKEDQYGNNTETHSASLAAGSPFSP